MAVEGIKVVSMDTNVGFWDKSAIYQLSMLTIGEIEPDSVWDMIAKAIKKSKEANKKIKVLEIHGHGNPGGQGVSYSNKYDATGTTWLIADGRGNLKGEGQFMQCLGPYFAAQGRIYLGGCHVAKGSAGDALLLAISKAV